MNPYRATAVSCAICGVRTGHHANWFLVLENRWLDRIKIVLWHPHLAELGGVLSVCGKQHLKELIVHWLTEPDRRTTLEPPTFDRALAEGPVGEGVVEPICGSFVGELAICREGRSRSWVGSPQMLDAILNALVGAQEPVPSRAHCSLPSLPPDLIAEVTLQ